MSEPVPENEKLSGRWIRFKEGPCLWLVCREFAGPNLLRALDRPWELMGAPSMPVPRDAVPRITSLVRATLPALAGTPLIIKRYRPKNFWQSLRDLFRPSRAQRAFKQGLLLREQNIPTPIPIAAGEVRCCRWLKESYLISEEIGHTGTLWEWRNAATNPAQVKVLARALAKMLARLHDLGFSHSDPNFNNFLVRGDAYVLPQLVVIDLDGIRRTRHISARGAAKDLYRLVRYMSPNESLWFVAQYCRARAPRLSARQLFSLLDDEVQAARKPSASQSA